MKRSKGFTLIELIIVLGIIAILAGVAVPGIHYYVQKSQMIQYNDYAKTIYLNAQSYLTEAKAKGLLPQINEAAKAKGQIVTEGMVLDSYYGGDNINYLMLSKSENESQNDSELIDILEDYVYDKSILDESICLEYNSQTGIVYSVCYSEMAGGFYYGNTEALRDEDRVSIADRSVDTRELLRVGYYSAGPIDSPAEKKKLEDSVVTLVNDDRLYLKWTDAQPKGEIVAADIEYTTKIWGEEETQESIGHAEEKPTPIMSIKVSSNVIRSERKSAGGNVNEFLVECPTTYYRDSKGNQLDDPQQTVEEHWICRKGDDYALILDCIDTSINPKYDIVNRYPQIGEDMIAGSVSAESVKYRPNSPRMSNTEHTLFATAASPGKGLLSRSVTTAAIQYPRHLYNMRFGDPSAAYSIVRDLSWQAAMNSGGMINGNLISGTGADKEKYAYSSLAYYSGGSSSREVPFEGTLNGKGNTFSGLYIKGKYGENEESGGLGLLAQNAGTVKNLNLTGLSVEGGGRNSVGGITGINGAGGTLQGNSVEMAAGAVIAAGDNTGGIAGENSGIIEDCRTDSSIKGGQSIGGVVGLNKPGGKLIACSTGGGSIEGLGDHIGGIIGKNESTQLTIDSYTNEADVTGRSYVGGIIGTNSTGKITNCENTGAITAQKEYAGGISGDNGTNELGEILNCTNKGVVSVGQQYAGGIAGRNGTKGRIINCASDVITGLTDSELLARSTGNFVGGIAGYNDGRIAGTESGEEFASVSSVVAGANYVGGIVGRNDTNGVIRSYEVTGGKVLASGDFAGGLIGVNTSMNVLTDSTATGMELYANPELVKGRYYVGGAMGANLVSVDGNRETILTFISNNLRPGKDKVKSARYGKVEASAYAGGVLGYSGVVASGDAGQTIDEKLQNTLNQLSAADPYALNPSGAGEESKVTTLIKKSNNNLNVTANIYVGGMIGLNSDRSKLNIEDCVNYGALSVATWDNQSNPKGTDYYFIGGITGRNSGSGKIISSVNEGNITSLSKFTGGIAEVNEGTIQSCMNKGQVDSSRNYVGGIVGLNGRVDGVFDGKSLMEDCSSTETSKVSGGSYIGGMAGENNGIMRRCYANGAVTGSGSYIGGVTGKNTAEGLMSGVSANSKAAVTGRLYVGGIVGHNQSTTPMEKLESSAVVKGENFVGGIAGAHDGTAIVGCTNKGKVSATQNGRTEVGGIIGANGPGETIRNCINSGDVTGAGNYTGGITSYNNGLVEDCFAMGGTVTGGYSSGGLIGLNETNGLIAYTEDTDTLRQDGFIPLKSNVASGVSATENGAVNIGGLLGANESSSQTTFEKYVFSGELRYKNPADWASTAARQYAGGILGTNRAGDRIEDCLFQGKIYGGNAGSGGITGNNAGIVKDIRLAQDKADRGKYLVGSSGVSGGIIGVCQPKSQAEDVLNGTPGAIGVLKVTGIQNVGGYFGLYNKTDQGADGMEFSGFINYADVDGASMTGGIIGRLNVPGVAGDYKLYDCINLGKVGSSQTSNATDTGNVGGIVGYVQPEKAEVFIYDCENKGDMTSISSNTGGIAGKLVANAPEIEVKNCTNGSVTLNANGGTGKLGGIVGSLSGNIRIVKCVNEGTVKSTNSSALYIGGIAGQDISPNKTKLTIEDCRNRGPVNRTTGGDSAHTGGILGGRIANISANSQLRIQDCLNEKEGEVKSSSKKTGGIVGALYQNGTVINCTNAALVDGRGDLTGGIAGQINHVAVVQNSVNLGVVKGSASYVGGVVGEAMEGTSKVQSCRNEGPVSGGTFVGGIAGTVKKNSRVEDCQNLGTVSASGTCAGGIAGQLGDGTGAVIINCINGDSENPGAATLIKARGDNGGIVGRMAGVNQGLIEGCINYGNLASGAVLGNYTGGIAGSIATGDIKNCRNVGIVDQKVDGCGGIVGKIEGVCSVLSSTNEKSVTGANRVSGIAGMVWGGTRFDIQNCKNKGDVKAVSADNAADVKSGGVVGEIYVYSSAAGTSTIYQCVNYGTVEGGKTGEGGIIGYAKQGVSAGSAAVIWLGQCVNYGEIKAGSHNNFGGIMGMAVTGISIEECYNFGTIKQTEGQSGSNLGGIIGTSSSSTVTVKRSINSAKVLGESGGQNVGGIAGANGGFIESCQTAAIDPNNTPLISGFAPPPDDFTPLSIGSAVAQITGRSNVGGLVGSHFTNTGDKAATIYTAQPKPGDPYMYSVNRFTIQLTEESGAIGGIAGMVKGGSIVTSYNTGDIVLPNSQKTRNVGGIAGFLTTDAQSDSIIAGTFHLGKMRWADGTLAQTATHYYGGIAGQREAEQKEKISIKDSFYIKDYLPKTTVDGAEDRWRIGNEPDFKGAEADTKKDGDGLVVCKLDDPKLEEFYQGLGGIPWTNPGSAAAAAEKFLQDYNYQLLGPDINSVEVQPLFSNGYTVKWLGGQGVLDGYRLEAKIYSPDKTTVIATEESQIIPKDAERVYSLGFKKENIGNYVQFGVKSIGQNPISTDSAINWDDEYYLILPPQKTPEVTAERITGLKYHFTIANPEDYKEEGLPKEDFENLKDLKDSPFDMAYEKYENGLDTFQMVIDGIAQPVTFERQEDGSYTADYTFILGATETKKDFTMNVTALPKLDKPYTYYVSEKCPLKITAEKTIKLIPPTVNLVYTGDLDTPAYRMDFDGPVEAQGYEYRIVEAGNESNVWKRGEVSGGGTKTLDLSTVPESMLGKSYVVYVKSKGDNTYFMDSDEEKKLSFTIVNRLPVPAAAIEPLPVGDAGPFDGDTGKDRYRASWSGATGGSGYEVSLMQTDALSGNQKILLSEPNAVQGSSDLSYSQDSGSEDFRLEDDLKLNLAVKQKGTLGLTLNSSPAAMEYMVYKRLAQPEKPAATQESSGSLSYLFQWNGVEAGEKAYCSGYEVYRVDYEESRPIYTLLGTTSRDVTSLNHTFDIEADQGKMPEIMVVAKGKAGFRSDSLRGIATTVNLQSSLKPPASVEVTPQPPSSPLSAADFETAAYQIQWTPPENSSGGQVVTQYHYRVVDETGTTVRHPDGTELSGIVADNVLSSEIHVSAGYGGQKLTVQVRAMGESQLSSPWQQTELVMPQIKLSAPSDLHFEPDASGSVTQGGIVTWSAVQCAEKYEIRIWSTPGGIETTAEALEAGFIIPKDAIKIAVKAVSSKAGYINSEESVLALDTGAAPLKAAGDKHNPLADCTLLNLNEQGRGSYGKKGRQRKGIRRR